MGSSRRPADKFAVVVGIIAFVMGILIVIPRSPIWYLAPPILAYVGYQVARRLTKGATITRNQFSIYGSGPLPAVADLAARVERYGYKVELAHLDETGTVSTPVTGGRLDAVPVRIRDGRAAAELGEIVLRTRVVPEGQEGTLVLIEADDTGPGFYEEMAQYVIFELGELYAGAEFLALGRSPKRRPTAELKDELPREPLGLASL